MVKSFSPGQKWKIARKCSQNYGFIFQGSRPELRGRWNRIMVSSTPRSSKGRKKRPLNLTRKRGRWFKWIISGAKSQHGKVAPLSWLEYDRNCTMQRSRALGVVRGYILWMLQTPPRILVQITLHYTHLARRMEEFMVLLSLPPQKVDIRDGPHGLGKR